MSGGASTQLDMAGLGDSVRNWVHYDTMVANLNKQAQATRQARDKFEQDIIVRLKRSNYENAVLQIAGGRLLIVEDRHSQPLTFKSMEDLLHKYFIQKGTMVKDETADILKFIKANRQIEVSQKLKRQNTV